MFDLKIQQYEQYQQFNFIIKYLEMLFGQTNDLMPKYRQMYKKLSDQKKKNAVILDLKVLENHNLENNEIYNFLITKLRDYNKYLTSNYQKQTFDSYNTDVYNNLYNIIRDVNHMDKRDDQQKQLKVIKQWLFQQEKILAKRMQQGGVRYKINSTNRKGFQQRLNKTYEIKPTNAYSISENLKQIMMPYYSKSRTIHQDYLLPSQRLKNYKPKVLNIQPIIQTKGPEKSNRTRFPKPVKQLKQQNKSQVETRIQNSIQGEPPNPEGEGGIEQEKEENNLGQEPQDEQPGSTQQNKDDNKLNPKIKPYLSPIKGEPTTRNDDIQTRGTFLYYSPDQMKIERTMEKRYNRIENQILMQKKQDQQKIEYINKWSKDKARVDKQLQKKTEELNLQPTYKYIQQQKPKQFFLSEAEEKKYFLLSKSDKKNTSRNEIDLSLQLPRLSQPKSASFHIDRYEKSVQKMRINDLKKKFSVALNLTPDVQEREILPKSLCHYTNRFKPFSSILNEHSPQRQRLLQLEQVQFIKERLTKNKVGVNVSTLSNGLCVPQFKQQQYGFPVNDLPNNPYMLQKKKKKKKK